MEEAPVKFELVDINEILKTLPHRYPMLLIDRVINIRTDYSGIGIKNVTFNEPPFLGHFPDRPVYPGVMMIEAMAQTAGVIGIKSVEGTEKPRAVYFLTIDKCKFRKPVMPGDTIEYHMRSIGRRKTMWWFHGDAKVNGTDGRRSRCRRDADGLTAAPTGWLPGSVHSDVSWTTSVVEVHSPESCLVDSSGRTTHGGR